MKKCLIFLSLFLVLASSFASAAYWTEKAQNPAYFPYYYGTITETAQESFYMDLMFAATNRGYVYCDSFGGPPVGTTNIPVWSTSDPLYGSEGYWPLCRSIGVWANNKYYIGGGSGPNENLSIIDGGRFPGAGYDGDRLSYHWPSNSYGMGFSYNRQSGFAAYDPGADSWNACKWDQTGLVGYNYGRWPDNTAGYEPGGTMWPMGSDGTRIGSNQAFAYDWDDDGTEEIFLHGGYPHWGGYCAVFDPDENAGQGSWSKTADALNFTGGYKAQYRGGTTRVGSNIYCYGGYYWGPDGGTHLQIYKPSEDSWERYEFVYDSQLHSFGTAAAGDKIYIISGVDVDESATEPTANVYALDVNNVTNGFQIVGSVAVPVEEPAVISYNGLFYIVGGLTTDGPTNLFQVFNPLTGGTVVNDTPLPVNAYAASCAVSPDGTFYFGGAMRLDGGDGWRYNSSRLWTGPLPEQDILVAPTIIDFWQTNDTSVVRIDNATGFAITCTNTPDVGFVSIQPDIVTVGGTPVFATVTVNRTSLNGPTNGNVLIEYGGGNVNVQISCDTPRPDPVVSPTQLLTLGDAARSFTIENTGSVPLYFTNTTADSFITSLSPATGMISPTGAPVTVSFDVTSAPRPGTGTVEVTYNSYDGSAQTVTVINNPGNYYVATTGDDANDGMSPATPWKTIAHGVNSIPEGDAQNGPITLNVAAGTYVDECTDAAGTNWIIDLSGRNYITVKGAGAERSFLTRETAVWNLTYDNDHRPNMPVVKLFNANNVRFSGFTIIATNPPARIDGDGDYPEMCGVVGIEGGSGVRVDHLLLDGTYHGEVYNEGTNAWQASWAGWWFHAININGVIGTGNAMVDHVLTRGFVRAVYNNNFSARGDMGNTNEVFIDHCTFVETICPSDTVQGVTVRVADADFGPSFTVNNCIIGNMPNTNWPAAVGAEGLVASAMWSASNPEYTLLSRSNQFWQVGTVPPYNAFKNANVIDTMPPDYELTDYTNEVPDFITVGGIPYSTDIDSPYGYRDVGWNVVPEPVFITLLAAAAAFLLAARRR